MVRSTDIHVRRRGAQRRASLRRKSAGSVMLIVATTLALLAVMGMFAMASAAREVRVSGFLRQSTQAHALSQAAFQAGASYLDPNFAGVMVHDYATGRMPGQTTNCISAAPAGLPASLVDALSSSCLRVMDADMDATFIGTPPISYNTTNMSVPVWNRTGSDAIQTTLGFEITYPHQQQMSGNASNQNLHYYRATVTTFAQVTSGDISKTETGRGHMVVGPFQD